MHLLGKLQDVGKRYYPLFLIFTDANKITFHFVNADERCRKKTKACEKASTGQIFDQHIGAGKNLLTVKLLNFLSFHRKAWENF